ncbi:MAG: FG-GAP-like repeat-containing protein [Planctomycetota bacterium]
MNTRTVSAALVAALLLAAGRAQAQEERPAEAASKVAYERGAAAYREKRWGDAEAAFREALREWPGNAVALNDLAWLYVTWEPAAQRRPGEALALARAATRLVRGDAAYLDTLATALDQLGAHARAAALELRVTRLDPTQAEFVHQLAGFAGHAVHDAPRWRPRARGVALALWGWAGLLEARALQSPLAQARRVSALAACEVACALLGSGTVAENARTDEGEAGARSDEREREHDMDEVARADEGELSLAAARRLAWSGRGRALNALGRARPAAAALERALALGADRDDPGLWSELAAARARLGLHAASAAAEERAVEVCVARRGARSATETLEGSALAREELEARVRAAEGWRRGGEPARAIAAVHSAQCVLEERPPLWPTQWRRRLELVAAGVHEEALARLRGGLGADAPDPPAALAARRAALEALVRAAAARGEDEQLDARVLAHAGRLRLAGAGGGVAPLGSLAEVRRELAVAVLGAEQDLALREAPLPPEARGSRVALVDVDGDGSPDLLLGGTRLFLNDGHGRFRAAPPEAGLPAGGSGGVFADFDKDGDLDLFVAGAGPRGDHLLRNDSVPGRVRFVDLSSTLGVFDDFPSEGAGWGDLNGDGWPDLYVANYEQSFPGPGTPDRLWLSDGKGGLRDASALIAREPALCGRGVSIADADGDGRVEAFVCNYRLHPDLLWGRDEAALRELAGERGLRGTPRRGAYGHTIGACWGDLDGDGRLDLVAAKLAHPRFIHFSEQTQLFLQGAGGRFRAHEGAAVGVPYEETHSHPTLFDPDQDGRLDLFVTSVYPGRPSFLLRNESSPGRLRFRDVTWAAGARVFDGWGAAVADVDGDGDQDLVVCAGGRARLFLAEPRPGTLAVRVRLRGTRGDTWGAGASATLREEDPDPRAPLRLLRQVTLGHGTTCQSEPILHFGVGRRRGPFVLEVRWASGQVSARIVHPGDRLEVQEPGS